MVGPTPAGTCSPVLVQEQASTPLDVTRARERTTAQSQVKSASRQATLLSWVVRCLLSTDPTPQPGRTHCVPRLASRENIPFKRVGDVPEERVVFCWSSSKHGAPHHAGRDSIASAATVRTWQERCGRPLPLPPPVRPEARAAQGLPGARMRLPRKGATSNVRGRGGCRVVAALCGRSCGLGAGGRGGSGAHR